MVIPAPQSRLPGLPALLDGSLWSEWLNQGRVVSPLVLPGAIGYLRLKPSVSCRALIMGPAYWTTRPPRLFRVDLYPTSEEAADRFEKEQNRSVWDKSDPVRPFFDPRAAAIVVPFPADAELPGLRHCFRPYRLRTLLEQLLNCHELVRRSSLQTRLLAYKPGRRAVLQVRFRLRNDAAGSAMHHAVLRILPRHASSALHEHLLNVDALRPDHQPPGLIGHSAPFGAVLTRWFSGEAIPRQNPSAALMKAAGRSLRELHETPFDSNRPLPALRSERSLEALAEDYCQLLPDESQRIRTLANELARNDAAPGAALIHGDLHWGQWVHQDGDVRLLDWDRARWGDPVEDLGAFAAHCIVEGSASRCFDQFRLGYQSEPSIELQTATRKSLFRRLGSPFRHIEPAWPDEMRRVLSEIESRGRVKA